MMSTEWLCSVQVIVLVIVSRVLAAKEAGRGEFLPWPDSVVIVNIQHDQILEMITMNRIGPNTDNNDSISIISTIIILCLSERNFLTIPEDFMNNVLVTKQRISIPENKWSPDKSSSRCFIEAAVINCQQSKKMSTLIRILMKWAYFNGHLCLWSDPLSLFCYCHPNSELKCAS